MNKHKILNGGQKRTLLGVQSKERQERLVKGGFRPYQPDKGAGKDCTQNKGKGKNQKKKARKELILNPDFQPLKHPVKKDMAMPGNRTTGLPATGLTSSGLQLLGGIARIGSKTCTA